MVKIRARSEDNAVPTSCGRIHQQKLWSRCEYITRTTPCQRRHNSNSCGQDTSTYITGLTSMRIRGSSNATTIPETSTRGKKSCNFKLCHSRESATTCHACLSLLHRDEIACCTVVYIRLRVRVGSRKPVLVTRTYLCVLVLVPTVVRPEGQHHHTVACSFSPHTIRTYEYLVPVAKIVEFRESIVISFVDKVCPSRYSAASGSRAHDAQEPASQNISAK